MKAETIDEAMKHLVFGPIRAAIEQAHEAGDDERDALSYELAEGIAKLAQAHYTPVVGMISIPARIDKVTTPDGKCLQITLSAINCVETRMSFAKIDNQVTVRGVLAEDSPEPSTATMDVNTHDDGQLDICDVLPDLDCPEPGNPEVVAYWAGYTSDSMNCPYDVDEEQELCSAYRNGHEANREAIAWYEDPEYPGSSELQAFERQQSEAAA